MKFSDFYQSGRFRYSFEVFPPKDEPGVGNLITALKKLSVFDPAFVSVTYGAMGSTRDLTRDLALRILHETKLTTASHFTCVGADKDSVKSYVERLKGEGIDLIVALRGDAPALTPGQMYEKPKNGFTYANELVAYLKEINGFSIAVAGYPEGHIEATSKEIDLQNLKRKVDAGADVILTQLFFDNKDYFDFVDRCREAGIRIPIVPGIMPILSLKQIEKISKMCGASLPAVLHGKLQSAAGDVEAMRRVGVDHAVSQARELKARGVPGIHFYALNKAESVSEVIAAL